MTVLAEAHAPVRPFPFKNNPCAVKTPRPACLQVLEYSYADCQLTWTGFTVASGSLSPLRGAAAAVAIVSITFGGLSIYFEADGRLVFFWFLTAGIAAILTGLSRAS